MGTSWFGSLQLAYKYAIVLGALFASVFIAGFMKVLYNRQRLKKHIKNSGLEASGSREERVELNKRDQDEGDLFGVRAIQSGYFGGVAQSRPTSAAGSHSPDGSVSNTLLGHPSPKINAHSPMSSVTTLPLDARQSSPLAKSALSVSENSRTVGVRRLPPPIKSALQPSEAELHGRINHDPAVNMYLEIPPSPVARPSSSHSDISVGRPLSPSYLFPGQPHAEDDVPVDPPRIVEPTDIRASVRSMSTTPRVEHEVHSQSASIVSKSSDRNSANEDRGQSPDQYTNFPATPAKTARPAERPISSAIYPPRSSSIPRGAPEAMIDRLRHEDVPLPKHPRISVVGEWGSEIFQEIDESLQHSKSLALSSPDETPQRNHHLSDSSSIYSVARPPSKYQPFDSNNPVPIPQVLVAGPSQLNAQPRPQHSSVAVEGTRRESDASNYQPSSIGGSNTGSHRHTKDIGDFYDSYWRQSKDGQMEATNSEEMRKHRTHGPVNGRGEKGKERRPGQLEVKVATIAEVPTPLASPSGRSPQIGKAI